MTLLLIKSLKGRAPPGIVFLRNRKELKENKKFLKNANDKKLKQCSQNQKHSLLSNNLKIHYRHLQ